MAKINRKRIYNITKGRCFYCGCKLSLSNFHADHFIAKSKGGIITNNLVPSCPVCNMAKGTLDIEAFRLKIASYLDGFSGKVIEKYFDVKVPDIVFYFEKEGIEINGE